MEGTQLTPALRFLRKILLIPPGEFERAEANLAEKIEDRNKAMVRYNAEKSKLDIRSMHLRTAFTQFLDRMDGT